MILKQSGRLAPANKPWQLIRDAIHDLTLQERCKSVRIDMGEWHKANGKCAQCLAGSVMSRRLGADTETLYVPSDFPACASRLLALNGFRVGCVRGSYGTLDLAMPLGVPEYVEIPYYEDDPAAFKAAMLELADTLEAAHKKPGGNH
jgi:hypothetical protein